MKRTLFALALLAGKAIAAPTMPVLYVGSSHDVVPYQDVLIKHSIVCSEREAAVTSTRLAGDNRTLEFKAQTAGFIESGECIIMDEDFGVAVDGMYPVYTQNGLLFVVRLVSGGYEFWTSANYLVQSRENTIKWTEQLREH